MSGAGAVKGREELLDTWPPTSPRQYVLLYLMGTDARGPELLWWNQKLGEALSILKSGGENNKLGVLLSLSETVG